MKTLTRKEIIILLAIYRLGDKAYLVTIRKLVAEITGKSWSIGATYVPLNRLYKLGFLDIRIGEPNAKRGRNKIKYYMLTPHCLEVLADIKQENDRLWAGFSITAYQSNRV